MRNPIVPCSLALALLSACTPSGDGDRDHATEIISRIELRFTPVNGGQTRVFAFSDPDGDGGVSGTAEPIMLELGTTYTLEIGLSNELVDPPADVGEAIADQAEQHFVFVLGEGVAGPASTPSVALVTHAYADLESDYGDDLVGDDLPLGLVNTITAQTAGTATLRVMLRHLPELNGAPQKSAELPAELAAGEALPGDVDVDVSFELGVS